MRSYNANAEKRIEDLISLAEEKPQDLGIANELLKEGLDILDKEFLSYPFDSVEDDCIRIQSELRIQYKIIQAYAEIIEEGYNPDPDERFSDIKRRLGRL